MSCDSSSIISFSYAPYEERKFIISTSSLKTLQLVMLLGTKRLKINSSENLSREKYSGGVSLEATFANKFALEFCILDIETILNA
jgi:hypothetical protein